MPGTSLERIQAAAGGVDNDSSPDYLATTEAAFLENLQPGSPGRLPLRGRFSTDYPLVTTFFGRPTAIWTTGDMWYVGAGTHSQIVSVPTSYFQNDATPASPPSSSVHASIGDFVYGAVTDALATGLYPKLGKFDPIALTFVKQSTAPAPTGFIDVKSHLQRLWVLGGTKPGTTAGLKPRSLFWSDVGGPITDALASWQDDVSGLVNEIVWGVTDDPVGLAHCGTTMCILTNRAVLQLMGTSSANFAIRTLSSGFGCVDARTIVEADDGFYYLSDRGFVFCDGASVKVVSKPIHGSILERIKTANVWSAAMFNNGYIGLCDGATGGRLWLFHIETGTWTTLRSDLWPNSDTRGCYVARTTNRPIIWDGKNVWDGNTCTLFAADANPARAIDSEGSLDISGSARTPATAAIPASWWSRVTRLASPSSNATIQRLLLDYKFEVASGSAVQPTSGWYVTVVDGQGNTLLTETQVPVGTTGFRKRFQVEVNAETTEAQVRASWRFSGSPPGLSSAELYDAYLEFTPAQARAST